MNRLQHVYFVLRQKENIRREIHIIRRILSLCLLQIGFVASAPEHLLHGVIRSDGHLIHAFLMSGLPGRTSYAKTEGFNEHWGSDSLVSLIYAMNATKPD